MNFAIFIQARLSSSRLPRKVLREICGMPLLTLLTARLRKTFGADQICLGTSDVPIDDELVSYASQIGISSARGPLDNIAQRLLNCAGEMRCDTVVRVWGDSPLICPELIEQGLTTFREHRLSYLSTFLHAKTFPLGLDFEIYSVSLLSQIIDSNNPFLCEFPFEWIKNADISKSSLATPHPHPEIALAIDYPEDLIRIDRFCRLLADALISSEYSDIVSLALRNPELVSSELPRNIEYNQRVSN